MNFLEGLKRLFIIMSLFVVAAAGFTGWVDGAPPYGCVKSSFIQELRKPSSADSSKDAYAHLSDVELLALHEKAKKDGGDPDWWEGARVVTDAEVPGHIKLDAQVCPTERDELMRRAGLAGGYAIIAMAILFAMWIALRWVLVGFFPSLRNKN